jgi:hypothetical protein
VRGYDGEDFLFFVKVREGSGGGKGVCEVRRETA